MTDWTQRFPDTVIPAPAMVVIMGNVRIGSGTILWPNTVLLTNDQGSLVIGQNAEIGFEGGFTIDARGHHIDVGNSARLLGGGSLSGDNWIGEGAQILGPIRCQRCRLGSGCSHQEPDPDQRGAVLKGAGVARDIHLKKGEVIQAFGLFAEAPIRRQIEFHPKT